MTIRRRKRDVAVVLSVEDYARLTRSIGASFQRFCDETSERAASLGMSEDRLAAQLAGDE